MGLKVPFPGMPAATGHELREGRRSVLHTAFAGLPRGRIGWVGTRILSVMTRPVNAALAESLHVRPDDDLLDVGCGAGVLLADRAAAVRFVAGLDASAVQVGVARERLADRISAGTAEVVQGDAAALPWEEGRFSAVACQACLPFLPDPVRALREMRRVLRPGGRVAVTAFPVKDPAESGTIDVWGQRLLSGEALCHLLTEAGFADVTVTKLPQSQLGLLLAHGVKPA
jgi:ubiquinone/menaquinone biosynthesis C-methylase UbiE